MTRRRLAVVTGGSRGMGAAVVRALAGDGMDVAFTYRGSADRAAELADAVGRDAPVARILPRQVDHADAPATAAALRAIVQAEGPVDVLVNNAGIFPYGPIGETRDEEIAETMAIHALSPFAAAREALAGMPSGGRIISIGSSLATYVPSAGTSLYSMTKAALIGMTKALAREVGARGITVNLVNPGPVDTDMNPADGPQADAERALIPAGRYGLPGEVAALVRFLASAEASFINGALIAVDGGATA